MRLRAQFVKSVFSVRECPRWNRVEIALAGRSNVGKSSLLNALTGSKGLARVSKTPGRTRAINLFEVDEKIAIADLPGYGYARMPQAEARKLSTAMREYLSERANLGALVLLVDSRRGPRADEVELAEAIGSRGVKLIVVATKCDKLKRSERARAIGLFKAFGITPIMCSVSDEEGIDELRRAILHAAEHAPKRLESDEHAS